MAMKSEKEDAGKIKGDCRGVRHGNPAMQERSCSVQSLKAFILKLRST